MAISMKESMRKQAVLRPGHTCPEMKHVASDHSLVKNGILQLEESQKSGHGGVYSRTSITVRCDVFAHSTHNALRI